LRRFFFFNFFFFNFEGEQLVRALILDILTSKRRDILYVEFIGSFGGAFEAQGSYDHYQRFAFYRHSIQYHQWHQAYYHGKVLINHFCKAVCQVCYLLASAETQTIEDQIFWLQREYIRMPEATTRCKISQLQPKSVNKTGL
jgi:hypothetical protein